MNLRSFRLAAVLAVATAGPVVAAEPGTAETRGAEESSLPPMLVRWPLAPRARGQALPPAPAATADVAADLRPAPVLPAGVPDERRQPGPEPAPRPEGQEGAPPVPEPAPKPVVPVLEPAPARPPLDRPGPTFEPAEPRPSEGPRRPEPPREPPAEKRPEPPSLTGPRRDREVDLPSLILPPPRLALELGSFEVKPPTAELRRWTFPEEEGVSWSSTEESRREGDWVILRGAVDVRVGIDRIQADEVRLNERAKLLHAEGNVVLDHLDSRLAGDRMEFDLETSTGTVWNAIGFARGDITFTGERVEKVGENKYVVYDGSFTSCTQPLPIWQVKVTKAIVDVDNFVYLFQPRVLFKKMPLGWVPWAAIPIKQERSTGFMVPHISSSSVRGLSVAEEFFWAINRSVDLTLGGRWWQDYGYSTDTSVRWHLHGMANPGRFEAIYVESKEEEEVNGRLLDDARWYATIEHAQDIWGDWKLTVRGEMGSDRLLSKQPFGGLQGGGLGSPTPIFNQRVTLQRRWGKHSLSINVENDERENEQAARSPLSTGSTRTSTRVFRRLPEAEYRLSSMQLGGRKWAALQMEAVLGYVQAFEAIDFKGDVGGSPVDYGGRNYDHDWYVADVYPQLRFPLGTPFLEVVPSLGLRATYWSRQETGSTLDVPVSDPDVPASQQNLVTRPGVDEGLFMTAWDAGLRLGGPDFQRIYRRGAPPGAKRWQHLIEPDIDFRFTPGIDQEHPLREDRRTNHYSGRFDKTGTRATLTLVNTLRSKAVAPVGERSGPARDWLIWRLSADYDFKEKSRTATFIVDPVPNPDITRTEASHWSDIRSDVNLRPTENIRFSLRNNYDILQDDITSTSLTGGVGGEWGYVDLAFTSRRQILTLDDDNTELTLTGENWFYKNDRIRLGYDFTKSFNGSVAATGTQRARSSWPYKRLALSYFNQCCGVSLSWEDIDDRSVPREREWTFIVTLKDVGNYLRLRERSTSD